MANIPTFPDAHNGVPACLGDYAAQRKTHHVFLRTKKTLDLRDEDVPVLPPGMFREVFGLAIGELKENTGDVNVVLNDKSRDEGYMEHPTTYDAFPIFEQGDTVSSATAYPGSIEDVQFLMGWANKHEFSVNPISIGRNIGYGGAGPRVRGSLTIDMGRRMNKAIKLDERSCSCIIRSDVTYFALYEAIQKAGASVMMDTPDLRGGSLIGNICERGIGYTSLGDRFANHCGIEVVLPAGEVVRLGMGSLPGTDGEENLTWASYQYASPHPTYGTCVAHVDKPQMGVWLMPKTDVFTYAMSFENDEDYASIMEIVQPLNLQRVFTGAVQMGDAVHEVIHGHNDDRAKLWDEEGAIPRQIMYNWMRKNSPFGEWRWAMHGAQYGTQESIEGSMKIIKDSLLKIPGARFHTEEEFPQWHFFHH